MAIYGLALAPLLLDLRVRHPLVLQPWYANDATMEGRASAVTAAMDSLVQAGPARGYFPSPEKSVVLADYVAASSRLARFNFAYKDGGRYLGSFLGADTARGEWLSDKILTWIEAVRILAKIAKQYPQTAYSGMARSLQMEWQYTLRVIPGVAALFQPLAQVIAEEYLPALLEESGAFPEGLRDRLALPARWLGLGIPDPSEIADECHSTSKTLTAPLTHSLRQRAWLDADKYSAGAAKAVSAARAQRDVEAESAYDLVEAAAVPLHKRAIRRSKENDAWLTTYPSYKNGTELSSDEFLDNLRLRFSLPPLNLPSHCDRCGQRLCVNHALQCKE
jgi:hypothetical protein